MEKVRKKQATSLLVAKKKQTKIQKNSDKLYNKSGIRYLLNI